MTADRRPSFLLGLALGGGAARGLAHFGVMDVLMSAGLVPRVIVGSSFGALAGAAVLARGGDARSVIAAVEAYAASDAFWRTSFEALRRAQERRRDGAAPSLREALRAVGSRGTAPMPAPFVAGDELRDAVDALLPDVLIEDLTLGGRAARFAAVAADVDSGEQLLIDRGSLRRAVRASCAIPGLMAPVNVAGRRCIDGGWVAKVPANLAAAMGADAVVAVRVSRDIEDAVAATSPEALVVRGEAIRAHQLEAVGLARADVVVDCPLRDVHWADFGRAAAIVEAGRAAASEALPRVERAVSEAAGWRCTVQRAGRRWLGTLTGGRADRGGAVRLAAETRAGD